MVLPVGGIKDKMLAAKRAGITTVLLPDKNRPQIEELEDEYKEGMKFIFLKRMDEVFRHAFVEEKELDKLLSQQPEPAQWPTRRPPTAQA